MVLEKVKAVESVFEQLDQEIAAFRLWSGLSCQTGCGRCCFKPDIEVTILELLPFAYYVHQINQAEALLEKLAGRTSVLCLLLDETRTNGGLCSEYSHRPLICRLFGFSARLNKYGNRELSSCRTIKTEQQSDFAAASERVAAGEEVPVISQYYLRLRAIDFELSREYFPINVAIRKAIEVILQYYAYRTV